MGIRRLFPNRTTLTHIIRKLTKARKILFYHRYTNLPSHSHTHDWLSTSIYTKYNLKTRTLYQRSLKKTLASGLHSESRRALHAVAPSGCQTLSPDGLAKRIQRRTRAINRRRRGARLCICVCVCVCYVWCWQNIRDKRCIIGTQSISTLNWDD